MIELTDGCKETVGIRNQLFTNLPLVIESCTIPQLNEEQKNNVVEKLVWLANNEYRARFYWSMAIVAALLPGTVDNPTKLTPLVMKWAGIRKLPEYRESMQKIAGAKNGRVLRSGKSL